MLTRDRLTEHQWIPIRNTPHHVVIAVSAAGGSPLDDLLEHRAGLQGIVDAMHSTHPLVREIAASHHIMHAQDHVRTWYYTLPDPDRTPTTLQSKAIESFQHALSVLAEHGVRDDQLHYSEFVLSLATRVARAAREGDLMGLGGQLVSTNERAFIQQIEVIVRTRGL
jgi:hypothetical protein